MQVYYNKRRLESPKINEHSLKNFKIDTSHYKSKGPKIIKTININLTNKIRTEILK